MDFIKKDVIGVLIFDLFFDKGGQGFGIGQVFRVFIIKCDFDDSVFFDPAGKQMVVIQIEQQIGFPAPAYACNDFDRSVFFTFNQPVQINIAFNRLHLATPIPQKYR